MGICSKYRQLAAIKASPLSKVLLSGQQSSQASTGQTIILQRVLRERVQRCCAMNGVKAFSAIRHGQTDLPCSKQELQLA